MQRFGKLDCFQVFLYWGISGTYEDFSTAGGFGQHKYPRLNCLQSHLLIVKRCDIDTRILRRDCTVQLLIASCSRDWGFDPE